MKRLFTVILHPFTAPCVQIDQNRKGWDLRKKAKISSKNTKKKHFWTFYISSKTVQAIETIFTVILHHIRARCVQLHQNRMAGI